MLHALWTFAFLVFGAQWVMPRSIVHLLSRWRNFFGKHSSLVWNLVPIFLLWTLWTMRNHCDFEDEEALLVKLKLLFIQSIFHWSSVLCLSDAHSIVDFIDSFYIQLYFSFLNNFLC